MWWSKKYFIIITSFPHISYKSIINILCLFFLYFLLIFFFFFFRHACRLGCGLHKAVHGRILYAVWLIVCQVWHILASLKHLQTGLQITYALYAGTWSISYFWHLDEGVSRQAGIFFYKAEMENVYLLKRESEFKVNSASGIFTNHKAKTGKQGFLTSGNLCDIWE